MSGPGNRRRLRHFGPAYFPWAALLALAAACGGRVTSEADDSGPGPAAEGQTPIVWSFGDEHTWVISGPSQAPSGTLYVVAYVTSDPDEIEKTVQAFENDDDRPLAENSRVLVALSPEGKELWRTELVPTAVRPAGSTISDWSGAALHLEWVRRPVVNDDGSVWAQSGGHYPPYEGALDVMNLTHRVSPSGTLLWSQQDWLPIAAVAQDGTVYYPTGRSTDDPAGFLRSVGPDGTVRWDALTDLPEPGLNRWELDGLYAPMFSSVALGSDGTVYAGCRRCVPGDPEKSGLAAFDPGTGALLWLVVQDGLPQGYYTFEPDKAIDEHGNIHEVYGGRVMGATPEGERVVEFPIDSECLDTTLGTPVIGRRGLVWLCEPPENPDSPAEPVIRLHLGAATTGELRGIGALCGALVLADPDLVLVRTTLKALCYEDVALLAVNLAGDVVWEYQGEPLPAWLTVLPGNGVIYAATESRKLVAIEAPMRGVDPGPWPMSGGNPGNTRRAL